MTNYKALLVDRVWAILRGSADLTGGNPPRVAVRNMLDRRQAGGAGQLRSAVAGGTGAADASPQVRIVGGRFTHTGWRREPSLGSEDGTDGGQPVGRTFRLTLEILSGEIDVARQDDIEEAVQLALLQAGPTLGLDFADPNGWEIESGTQEELPAGVRGADWCRLRTRMTLAVPVEFDARDLLAEE